MPDFGGISRHRHHEPQPAGPFWCGLLDVEVDTTIGEGQFVLLTPTAAVLRSASSASPTPKPGRTGCTST